MTPTTITASAPESFDRTKAIQWLIAAATAFMVFAPLIPIVIQAFLDRPLYDRDAALTLTISFVFRVTNNFHSCCGTRLYSRQ